MLFPAELYDMFNSILACLAGALCIVAQTPPVEISGYRFFEVTTGDSVNWKGVNYYPRANSGPYNENNLDFFHDEFRHVWERDIEFFKELGVNAIRLYAVDPAKNHDSFMCALQQLGIYVIVGLAANCIKCAITAPPAPYCYPSELKERGEKIINEFARYDNVLAFSGGNEINLFVDGLYPESNAPCQKKFVRDMRAYIDSCEGMRSIPVGLVIADISREANALYYNCQDDPDDPFGHAEWYGTNTYLTCDPVAGNAAYAFRERTSVGLTTRYRR